MVPPWRHAPHAYRESMNTLTTEAAQIEAAITALQAQRALLGDAVVDAALPPLRERLALLSADVPEQQLKQVSILFADIVGSTTLAERLDPEEVHAVMDGTLTLFAAEVQARQGRVLQYAGDSMLAVFGAPESREDDAARAVRAGLAVLRRGAEQGELVRRRHGHAGFDVRVGVHTGPVLLGGGVDGDGSIRGISVNIAARLEQSAPAGQLRISQATWQQVRGLFDVTPQPPLTVKGVGEPLVSYLVHRELDESSSGRTSAAARGVVGLQTPLVGRQGTLTQLQQALAQASAGASVAALLVGEAGLGKSRLALAFEQSLAAAPAPAARVLRARAVPQGHAQPYSLLRALLLPALQTAPGADGEAASAGFESAIARLFVDDQGSDVAQAQAHVLGYLLGFDFGASRHLNGLRDAGLALRSRAFHVAAQWLRRLAAHEQRVLVLLLDDLHWADDGSLQFLQYLLGASAAPPLPMLVLAAARPALFERLPDWPGPGVALTRIDLQPLAAADGEVLARALLSRLAPAPGTLDDAAATAAALAGLHDFIVRRAEGNPFYMEELVSMLIDEGAIELPPPEAQAAASVAPPWRLRPERLRLERMPSTLTGVLQSRLDSLALADKAALQRAAIVGMQFWDLTLAALDPAAPHSLPLLCARHLVLPQDGHGEATLGAAAPFSFAHQMLHQVAYETVLKRVRAAGHLAVAAWLAAQPTLRERGLLVLAATHFERGGNAAQAAEYYARSAEHLQPRYAHATVVEHATLALALAAPDAWALRWRVLLVRQRSLRLQGRMAEQAADLDALAGVAEALDDNACRATVGLRRAVAMSARGDAAGCVAACPAALALALRAQAAATALAVYSAWAGALRSLGRYGESRGVGEEGLALAHAQADRSMESELLTGLAAGATQQSEPLAALALLQQSLAIDRATANRTNECTTLVNLGDACTRLGDFEAAREHLAGALQMALAIGIRGHEAMSLLNLAGVTYFLGEPAQALGHAEAAARVAAAAGNRQYEAFALMSLGHAALALAQTGRSEQAYSQSAGLLREIGLPHLALEADAGLARLALARGQVAAAHQHLQALLVHLGQHTGEAALDGCEHPLWMRLTCVQVLQSLGDPASAGHLAAAHAELQAQAGRIEEAAARDRFLRAMPHHRAISALVLAAAG